MTEQAAGRTKSISERVIQLGVSTEEITAISNTINEISEQTNLLALNATIEAARRVRPARVLPWWQAKSRILATQTASATESINARITNIQSETRTTIDEIVGIADAIDEVSRVANAIASAVEEQAATARETAGGIDKIAAGVEHAFQMVSDGAEASHGIASEVGEVAAFSTQISDVSSQLNNDAEQLAGSASHLEHAVGAFRA